MITIDYSTFIISVPQSYLALISGTVYELDVNQFRLDLKDLEDDANGMPFPITHNHNTEVVLSGVTYARTVEIINGYTVFFEDTGSHYTVSCTGANHNLNDVTIYTGHMTLAPNNSAGLQTVISGGGITVDDIMTDPRALTKGKFIALK